MNAESIVEAEQKLAALEKMRQDFVANVSHELRTPLTVIRGYLEMLVELDEIDKTRWQPKFAQMFAQSLRMEQLIADLLFLSRLEVDSPEQSDQSDCDVVTLTRTICDEASVLSFNDQHQISVNYDESLALRGNYDELRSAFSNIIFNAVKYTPESGQIDVRWFKNQAGQACFSVKDSGIGIAEKDILRLTERFYRVDKARSRDNGGTGLGLAIVKHILLRHDGALEIESELGQGSVFTCFFASSRVLSLK